MKTTFRFWKHSSFSVIEEASRNFSKETWNKDSAWFDAAVTETPPESTRICIDGFHEIRLDEIDSENEETREFPFFAEDFLNIGDT